MVAVYISLIAGAMLSRPFPGRILLRGWERASKACSRGLACFRRPALSPT